MWHTGSRGSHTSTQGHGRGWRGRGGYRDSVATPSGNATRGRYSAAWSQEKSVERDGSHRSLASYPQRRYDVVPPHNERGTWVTEPEGYLDWMAARTAPSSGTLGERPARCGAPLANGGVDVWTPEPEHDWSHAPGCQPEAGPVGSSRGAHGPLMKTPYPAPHPEAPPRTPWRAATYRQPEGYGTGRGSASVYRPPTRGGLVGPEPIAPSLHGGTVAPPAPALSVPPWPEPPPTYSRGGSHVARHQEPPSFDDFSRQMMSGFSPLHGPPHPAHPPPPFVPHHHHYRGHGFTPQHPQHHRSRHRGNAYDVPPPQPSQASGRSTSSPNFPDPVEIAMEAEPAAHRHVESAVPAPYESLTGETQALRPAIGDTAVIISTPLWGSLKEPGSVIPCGLIGGDEVSPRPEAHRVIGVPVTDWPTAPQSADPSPLPQHDTAVTASVFEVGQPASSEAPPTITTVASPEHVHSHSPTVPHATEPPHGAGDAAACPHRLGRNSSRGSGTPRSRTAAAESPLSLAATTKGATEGDISVLLGSVGRFFAPTPLAFVCAAPHIRQNWEVAEWTRARLATIEAHFPEVVDPTTAVMVQDVKQDGKSFRPGVMMPILGRRAHGSHSALLLDDAWKRGKLVSPGIAQRVHSVELPLILDDGEGMVHVFMKERLPRPTLPWLARPRREPRADPLKTHPQHCHTELSNPSPSALAAHVFEQQLPGLVEDMNALPVLHGFYCAALTFTFPRGAWEQVMRKLRSQGALRVFRVSRRELVETEDLDAPYMEDDDDDEEEEPEGGANTHTIRTAQQATPPRPGSPATTGISAADQVTSTSLPLAHGEREGTGAPRTGGPTHPSLTHTPVEVAPTVAGRSIGGGDGGEITNRAVAVSPTSGVASLGATVALESSLTQAGASRSLSRSLRGLGSSQHGAWPQTSIVPHFSLDGFEDFPHLQVVGIESCDVRTLAPLAACQDLREIYIQSCANLTAEGVRDGVKSLRKLEVLWLEATAVRELSFLATCTMLRELHMAMDPLFVTSSLRGVEQLPCLLNLRLDHVFVDDVSFLERSRSLRSLVITHCRIISAKALHGIENMPNLELLSLEYANDVRSVSFLEQAKSLKHLLLTRCHGLGTVGLRGVEHIPTLETLIVEHTRVDSVGFLASAPALTELRLKGCKRILRMSIIGLEKSRSLRTLSLKDTNVINVTALTGSTTIVELNLDSCRHLQQEGAEPLATMTSLEVLRMSATPISCVRFLSANGRLRELILDDCPNLTAHGLMGLTSLPMLEVLSLCSSQEVHEVGFLGECPSLRILRINGLERLRTPGLVGIERAARLEELYMEWCGVNSIVCLSHGCPCLRIIHASGCQRIANDGLHGLEKLPCLTHLMLDDLDLIDHIEFLKDAPALRKLSLRRCPGINAHGGECLRSIAPTVQIVW